MREEEVKAYLKRYDRLIISDENFEEAKKYAEKLLEILEKNEQDDVIIQALNVAIITTYSIPFSINKDKEGKNSIIERKKSKKRFTDEESILHKKIINKRNKIVAHSDSSKHRVSFKINRDGARGRKRKIYKTLEEDKVVMIIEMIDKIRHYITFECLRIQKKLPDGTEV